jgi:hypothetical protein
MIRIDSTPTGAVKVGNDYYPLNGYLIASAYLTTGVTITERISSRVIAKGIPFADYVDATTSLPLGATQATTISALNAIFNAVGDSGLDVANLDDVTLTSLVSNQVIAYNAGIGKWVNVDLPANPAVEDNGGTPVLASGITQAEMQSVLNVDPAGTDNSTDATVGATASDVLKMAAGQSLGAFDAGSDKLVFWDDSDSKLTYATIGTNLTMTGTTLNAAGGGGSGGVTSLNSLIGGLTLAAGSNVTITDNGADTITIASSGGGGGGGSAGGNFMITGFTTSSTQQWYGLYLPYANNVRTSGNWQHYQIYHMPADGSFNNFSMHVQGNCQIEFGINVNPQTPPNNQADGTQYNYKQLSPTGSNHTSNYSPTTWTFSAGDEIGFGFRNVSGGVPFYITFNVCFTFN